MVSAIHSTALIAVAMLTFMGCARSQSQPLNTAKRGPHQGDAATGHDTHSVVADSGARTSTDALSDVVSDASTGDTAEVGVDSADGGPSDGEPLDVADTAAAAADTTDTPTKLVQLVSDGAAWKLMVNGQPFVVRGGGGSDQLELLVKTGANTIRTWGVGEDTPGLLDEAHKRGLKVIVGLWMKHPKHFDYTDSQAVQTQQQALLKHVKMLKDHPAVLLWGVGNELALDKDVDQAWDAINALSKAIHQLDSEHPTMLVTASVNAKKYAQVVQRCGDVDIWGVNHYGNLQSVQSKLVNLGWKGPWLITEFGPSGPWETSKTAQGASVEASTAAKQAQYASRWKDAIEPALTAGCLGGVAFAWRHGKHATDTWFPLFRADGAPTSSVDALHQAWKSTPPKDLGPVVTALDSAVHNKTLDPGAKISATLNAKDPEGGQLSYLWMLAHDDYAVDIQAGLPCSILSQTGAQVSIVAPTRGGRWRLVGWAKDAGGKVGQASVHFHVSGSGGGPGALPMPVESLFSPSGWMGDQGGLKSLVCVSKAMCAGACHHFRWKPGASDSWVGVAWLNQQNWGAKPGVSIADGAKFVRFTAWAEEPGRVVSFNAGVDKDAFKTSLKDVALTTSPKEYSIALPFSPKQVLCPFGFVMGKPKGGAETNLHLANIRWTTN